MWYEVNKETLKQDFSKIENLSKFWDCRFTVPYIKDAFIISLGEGGTPCRRSKKFGEKLGLKSLYFKDETQNPTNSFKDRVAALLTSHARSWDYDKIICASNGNQGASLAAYTSIEGMTCMNIIPEIIDVGKKAQMIAYDSKLEVRGKTVDDAIVNMLKRENIEDFYQGTAELNPLTLEAQKTIAYELIKQVEDPNWILIPMGSGELLVSLWKGFHELLNIKVISRIPKLIGIQSQVLSPIADAFFKKDIIDSPNRNLEKSLALGILVKKPLYSDFAIKCIRESGGTVITIPEDNILNSIDKLIRYEGIFAEPASALTVAALESLNREDMFGINEKIICIITGSGLKAPYVLEAISSQTKTTGKGSIIITKLKILSQVSLSSIKGISGTKIQEIMGTISLAAIYQHLKELESKGLISRKKEGKNVFYFITESGKKVLDALDVLITLL
ncbi:MAG: pyridoxal-phosphate dependent enzyme [Promethearchaeota archaeon]